MCKTAFNYDVKKGKERKPQYNMFGKTIFFCACIFYIRVELAAHAWFSSDCFFFFCFCFLHQAPLLHVFVNGPLAQTINRTVTEPNQIQPNNIKTII